MVDARALIKAACAILLTFSSLNPLISAPAIAQSGGFPVWVVGAGRQSCATWLSNAELEYEGNVWVFGFWTGANFHSGSGGTGSTTDALGLLGEIKLRCQQAPADQLAVVAWRVYQEFKDAAR